MKAWAVCVFALVCEQYNVYVILNFEPVPVRLRSLCRSNRPGSDMGTHAPNVFVLSDPELRADLSTHVPVYSAAFEAGTVTV